MIATTHPAVSVAEPTLYVAFELGQRQWKLAITSGFGVPPWLRTVASGDLGAVERVIREGRRRFGVAMSARVVSCYEAGRDAFGFTARCRRGSAEPRGHSASIEVNRRARRRRPSPHVVSQRRCSCGVLRRVARVERVRVRVSEGRAPGESSGRPLRASRRGW